MAKANLIAYGARLVLTEGDRAMLGPVARAEQVASSDKQRYLLLDQFKTPSNPAIRLQTTGPEIWDDTPVIEDEVVIHAGATVLGRVTVGRDSVIGANLWLATSVPPGSNISQARTRSESSDEGSGA